MERPLAENPLWRLPAYGRACFDMLPATVLHALGEAPSDPGLDLGALAGRYERVLLVYFDAFGWRWYERHSDHPLLAEARARGAVSTLTSQFPSTTAAHMTTIHSGIPVGVHGVYEWFTLLPSLNRIVAPLLFSFAGDDRGGTLVGHASGAEIFPEPAFYAALRRAGVASHVAFPQVMAASPPSQMLRGQATIHAFAAIDEAVGALGAGLGAAERAYGFLYLPDVDTAMHKLGPDDAGVERMIDATLGELQRALLGGLLPAGTLVLVSSDHGMAAIDPQRTLYVNELWPELASLLAEGADGRPLAPAGSSRDLFLHTRAGCHEQVRDGLARLLEGRAEVHATAELLRQGVFGPRIGERLRERVGDVVALPFPGEAVYWHEPPRFSQPYRGQHGGLSHAEMEIPLLALVA